MYSIKVRLDSEITDYVNISMKFNNELESVVITKIETVPTLKWKSEAYFGQKSMQTTILLYLTGITAIVITGISKIIFIHFNFWKKSPNSIHYIVLVLLRECFK